MAGSERSTLRLVHHHPGRLRLRAEGIDEERARGVHAALETVLGVLGVRHNLDTGSVLVEYEPGKIDPSQLVDRVALALGAERVLDETGATKPTEPAAVVKQTAAVLDALTREITGGRADLRVLVPAALGAAAAYSWVEGKGPRLPRWDNLLWWSYSVFVHWNSPPTPTEPVAPTETE